VSESDSFIDEVAEEVRRDQLFAMFRKYGWIAITAVLLIVGAAAWNEWQKARHEAAAQAFGDAVTKAVAASDPAARLAALAALAAVTPTGAPGQAAVLGLLIASQAEAAGKHDEAVKALQAIIDNAKLPDSYRQLAQLKLVMLDGAHMDGGQRDSLLAALAAPGAPYRTLAMEQQAVVLLDAGKTDAAADLLGKVAVDADATPAEQGRAKDILVALGKAAPDK